MFAPSEEFFKAKTALLEAFPDVAFEVQEITFVPQATQQIPPDDVPMFEKFMTMLNECEDVQDVYHNAELPGLTIIRLLYPPFLVCCARVDHEGHSDSALLDVG